MLKMYDASQLVSSQARCEETSATSARRDERGFLSGRGLWQGDDMRGGMRFPPFGNRPPMPQRGTRYIAGLET
jgi:hypothetical protein